MTGNADSKPKPQVKVVLAGSYHKYKDDICKIKSQMEIGGMKVLEPLCGKSVNKGGDFVVFENDNAENLDDSTYQSIQKRFMDHCQETDIVYVYNKEGYAGLSTAFETGYAKGLGKKIYCHEIPKDKGLQVSDFCEVMSVDQFIKLFHSR